MASRTVVGSFQMMVMLTGQRQTFVRRNVERMINPFDANQRPVKENDDKANEAASINYSNRPQTVQKTSLTDPHRRANTAQMVQSMQWSGKCRTNLSTGWTHEAKTKQSWPTTDEDEWNATRCWRVKNMQNYTQTRRVFVKSHPNWHAKTHVNGNHWKSVSFCWWKTKVRKLCVWAIESLDCAKAKQWNKQMKKSIECAWYLINFN